MEQRSGLRNSHSTEISSKTCVRYVLRFPIAVYAGIFGTMGVPMPMYVPVTHIVRERYDIHNTRNNLKCTWNTNLSIWTPSSITNITVHLSG